MSYFPDLVELLVLQTITDMSVYQLDLPSPGNGAADGGIARFLNTGTPLSPGTYIYVDVRGNNNAGSAPNRPQVNDYFEITAEYSNKLSLSTHNYVHLIENGVVVDAFERGNMNNLWFKR